MDNSLSLNVCVECNKTIPNLEFTLLWFMISTVHNNDRYIARKIDQIHTILIVFSFQDLKENDELNELAKNASSPDTIVNGSFGMEHFDYENYIIADRMLFNWNQITFLGLTVRTFMHNFMIIKPSNMHHYHMQSNIHSYQYKMSIPCTRVRFTSLTHIAILYPYHSATQSE